MAQGVEEAGEDMAVEEVVGVLMAVEVVGVLMAGAEVAAVDTAGAAGAAGEDRVASVRQAPPIYVIKPFAYL